MPHIVVEYSDNLKDQVKESDILKAVHTVVVDSGLFSPEAVKARAISYSDYVLPHDAVSFIHITVSILSGRDIDKRNKLGDAVFNMAKACVADCDKLSVDINEMEAKTYKK